MNELTLKLGIEYIIANERWIILDSNPEDDEDWDAVIWKFMI